MPVWSKPVRVDAEYIPPTFSDDAQTFLTEFHDWLDSQLDEPVDGAISCVKPDLSFHAHEDARYISKHVEKLSKSAANFNERASLTYVLFIASVVINAVSGDGAMPDAVSLLEMCYKQKDERSGSEPDLMKFIDQLAQANVFFFNKKQGQLSLRLADVIANSWLVKSDVFADKQRRIYQLLFLGELHARAINLTGLKAEGAFDRLAHLQEFVKSLHDAERVLAVDRGVSERIFDLAHASLLLTWQHHLTAKKLKRVIDCVVRLHREYSLIVDKKVVLETFQITYADIDGLIGRAKPQDVTNLLNAYEASLDEHQAALGADWHALKAFVRLSKSSIFERQFLSFSQAELKEYIALFKQGVEMGRRALAEGLDYFDQVQIAIEKLDAAVSAAERRIDRLDKASDEDGFIPTLASPTQFESLSRLYPQFIEIYLSAKDPHHRSKCAESIASLAKRAGDFFDEALDAQELAQLTYVRLSALVCVGDDAGFSRGDELIAELYAIYGGEKLEFAWQIQSAFIDLFRNLSRLAGLCLNSGALKKAAYLVNLCSISAFHQQCITHPELASIKCLILAEVEVMKLKCHGVKHKATPQMLKNLRACLATVDENHLTDPDLKKRGALVLLDEKMLRWEYEPNIERFISFLGSFNDACVKDASILNEAETLYYIGLLFSKFSELLDRKNSDLEILVDKALLFLDESVTLKTHASQYFYYVRVRFEFLNVFRIASKGQGFNKQDQALYAACRSGLEHAKNVRQHMGNLPAEVERFEQYFRLFLELDGLSLNERKRRFNEILIKYFSLEKAETVEVDIDIPLLDLEPEALVFAPAASASSEAESSTQLSEESVRQELAAFSMLLAQIPEGPYATQANKVFEKLQALSDADEMLGAKIFSTGDWPQLFNNLYGILSPKKSLLSDEDKLAFLGYEPFLPKKLQGKWRKLCQIAVLDVEPVGAVLPERELNLAAQPETHRVEPGGDVTDVDESGDDGSDMERDPVDENPEADVVVFASALPASPPKQQPARVKRTGSRQPKKSKPRPINYHAEIKDLMWALGFEYWGKDSCYYLADNFVYRRFRFSLSPSEHSDIVLRRFNVFVKTETSGLSQEPGYSARVRLVENEATAIALRTVDVDKFFKSIKNLAKPKTRLAAALADPVETSVSGVSPATPSPTTTRLMRESKAPDSPGGSSGSDPGYGSAEAGSSERPVTVDHPPASSLDEAIKGLFLQFGGGGRSMFSSQPPPEDTGPQSDAERQLTENLKKPYGLW
jgi:hypothetical protein